MFYFVMFYGIVLQCAKQIYSYYLYLRCKNLKLNKTIVGAICVLSLAFSGCTLETYTGETESPFIVEIVSPTAAPTEKPKTSTPEPKTAAPATTVPTQTAAPETEAPTEKTTEKHVESINTDIKLNLPENPNSPYPSKYGSPITGDNVLSNEKMAWYFGINDNYLPPTAQSKFDIREFNGYYLGDITQREIYLTFDVGYENGFTPAILDCLKDKGIKAAFFVTKPFVESNLDLVTRMLDEGHLVCSHSVNHKSSPDLTDSEMEYELAELARYFKEKTGRDIAPYFRPPMGEYSARTLDITDRMGYKSIFWSFAYKDWDTSAQPGMAKAFNTTVTHMHNGAIVLLHAVSESNAQALPYIIDALLNNGFEFKTLDELPD